MAMDRVKKVELIERTLGIRHKIKVHESMKSPESHEDFAVMLLSKWELEDELHAIEQLLAADRHQNVEVKKDLVTRGILGLRKKKSTKK